MLLKRLFYKSYLGDGVLGPPAFRCITIDASAAMLSVSSINASEISTGTLYSPQGI